MNKKLIYLGLIYNKEPHESYKDCSVSNEMLYFFNYDSSPLANIYVYDNKETHVLLNTGIKEKSIII